DFQINVLVSEINATTREIAELNEKIQSVEISGNTANDERDRREHLLKELGSKVNIKYAEGDRGLMTITAGNNAILVSGTEQVDLIVANVGKSREGAAAIMYKPNQHSTPLDVTRQLRGGALGGLLEVRDEFVAGLRS